MNFVRLVLEHALSLATKGGFATRCALAGDPLLSVATKVGKNAFYRRQRVAVRVDGTGGWVFDCGVGWGSSCSFVMFRFGARAMT